MCAYLPCHLSIASPRVCFHHGQSTEQRTIAGARSYRKRTTFLSSGILTPSRSIPQFLDGNSYSKGKLEEAFRTLRLDKPYPKPAKAAPTAHRAEDIDLIVSISVHMHPKVMLNKGTGSGI